jgi:hypothetical protein
MVIAGIPTDQLRHTHAAQAAVKEVRFDGRFDGRKERRFQGRFEGRE